MAPIDLRSAPQPQSRLLSLPGEMQLIIFGHAFTRSAGIKVLDKDAWRARERKRKREHHAPTHYEKRPFPGSAVSNFTVSKKFYALSASVYACSQPISVDELFHGSKWAVPDENNAFVQFGEEFICDAYTMPRTQWPSLKKITVTVTKSCFYLRREEIENDDDSSDEEPSFASERVILELFREEDFARLTLTDALNRVDSSVQIHIAGDRETYLTEAELRIWNSNIAAYETYLRTNIMRPKLSPAEILPGHAQGTILKQREGNSTVEGRTSSPQTSTNSVGLLAGSMSSRSMLGKRDRLLEYADDTPDVSKRQKSEHAPSTTLVPSRRISQPLLPFSETFSSPSFPAAFTDLSTTLVRPQRTRIVLAEASPPLHIPTSLGSVLPQLEHLLDTGDPALAKWVTEMRAKGKI